jgi:hypothetical protein
MEVAKGEDERALAATDDLPSKAKESFRIKS